MGPRPQGHKVFAAKATQSAKTSPASSRSGRTRFNRDGHDTITGPSGSELYQEITPIVVHGIMYTPSGDRVVALEPETGKEIWSYELAEGLASFRGGRLLAR
ncbi:MAG: hypothetical protein WDO18_03785 [Acidobacteriota bacterium]